MDATSKKASAENIPIKQVSSAYSGPVDTFSGRDQCIAWTAKSQQPWNVTSDQRDHI